MRSVPLAVDRYDAAVRMDPRPMFPRSFHPLYPNELPDRSGTAPWFSRSECAPTYYISHLYWSQVGDVELIKHPIVPPGSSVLSAVSISELAGADIVMANHLLSGCDLVSGV